MDWKKQCTFLATVLVTFALIIAPFVFWEGSTLLFFEYNPFVLQTRQGSVLAGIIFFIIALGITIYLGEDQRTRLLRHLQRGERRLGRPRQAGAQALCQVGRVLQGARSGR